MSERGPGVFDVAPSDPAFSDSASTEDVEVVSGQLGHRPRGLFTVVVRNESGVPIVIRNSPRLFDGTPMPTLYWLTGPEQIRAVGRLESAGGVNQAEADVDAEELAATHARYAKTRDAAWDPGHRGIRPSGGVAGTRRGVKCLHAHYAYYLAGGDDPVGRWVAARLLGALGCDGDESVETHETHETH